MSDDIGFDAGSVDPGGSPGAEGVAPETGTSEPEATPSHDYLDTGEYGSHYVRLKVDGEEVEVPLSEALSGYSRQADYTRKTQELAEQQRAAQFGMTLQQALETNPAETIRLLQSQFAQPEPEAEPEWTDDPNEARFREMDRRLQMQETRDAELQLRQALGVLQQRYGDDFVPMDVVARASEHGRLDLENVYKEMAFERYWSGQQAAREQQAAEEQGRIDAKSSQAQMVHSGNGSNNTATPDAGSYPTISEAFYAAKRSLGMT